MYRHSLECRAVCAGGKPGRVAFLRRHPEPVRRSVLRSDAVEERAFRRSFQRPAPLRERRGCHASGSFRLLTLITAPTVPGSPPHACAVGWSRPSRSHSLPAATARAILFGVDLARFEESLQGSAPPAGVSGALEALWYERRGGWDRAHEIAQDIAGTDGSWVHAYLHRREGDLSNAAYWYRQAGKPVARGNLDDEWRAIVEALLTVL